MRLRAISSSLFMLPLLLSCSSGDSNSNDMTAGIGTAGAGTNGQTPTPPGGTGAAGAQTPGAASGLGPAATPPGSTTGAATPGVGAPAGAEAGGTPPAAGEPNPGETPAAGTSMAETPMALTPAGEEPMGETPMAETPTTEDPADPAGEDPMGEDPMGEDPMTEDPAQAAPDDGAFLENRGEDCEVGEIPANANSATLPDPFTKLDGTRITTKAEWRCRRQEIVKTVEEQIYGWKGPKPDSVTGSVTNNSIDVTVTYGGNEVSFSAGLSLPGGGDGPYPAIVILGGIGGVNSQILTSEGVASINYTPTEIAAETGSGRGKQGAFFTLYGQEVQSSGSLVAWAWGVSRIIDVIEQSDQSILRADGMAVTGCSRYGKGAFSIGMFDERIALTIPIESGSGGVPIWRGVTKEGAQPPDSAYSEQPWLGDAFRSYQNSVNNLAADQHEVVGMGAPRGLLILDNPHIDWLGARFGHASALAGAEIYKALGVEGNIGYYSAVENGNHCAWRDEWNEPTRNAIQRHLHKADAPDLEIVADGGRSADVSDWVDWDTPTLQ